MTALALKTLSGGMMTMEDAANLRHAMKNSLYPGASDDSVDMVLSYCQARGLDPMTKPVHIVPMWVVHPITKKGGMRDVVMPGIELYRTNSHRTGEYVGQDECVFGPDVTQKLGNIQFTFPQWCKITVYRLKGGVRVPFTGKVYFLETYATASKDSDEPNKMWRKRPYGQLEKCAEALALRKAFPEAVGGENTADEMAGKTLYTSDVTAAIGSDSAPAANNNQFMPQEVASGPQSGGDVVDAEFTPQQPDGPQDQPQKQPSATDGGGWTCMDGARNLITKKAAGFGLDEAAIFAKWGAVSQDKVNGILRDLTAMGAAQK